MFLKAAAHECRWLQWPPHCMRIRAGRLCRTAACIPGVRLDYGAATLNLSLLVSVLSRWSKQLAMRFVDYGVTVFLVKDRLGLGMMRLVLILTCAFRLE